MPKYSFDPQPECPFCYRLDKPFCTSRKQAKDTCDDFVEYFLKDIEENEDMPAMERLGMGKGKFRKIYAKSKEI